MTVLRKRWALKPPELRVLECLLEFDDPERGCFPTQVTIAEWTGLAIGTVAGAISSLAAKGVIDRVKKGYWDARGRWCKGKINHYFFAEELENLYRDCVEIGRQREELERRSTPIPLPFPDPNQLDGRAHLDPNQLDGRAHLDQPLAGSLDPNQLDGRAHLDPNQLDGRAHLDQTNWTGARQKLGGGGIDTDPIDQSRSSENHHHLPAVRSPKAISLSMHILCHPDIAMAQGAAIEFAAHYDPQTILAHCMVYRHELEAGIANGIGILVYRLRNRLQPRTLTQDESGGELYSEFHNDVVDLNWEEENEPELV